MLSDTIALLNIYQVNEMKNTDQVMLDLVFTSIETIKVETSDSKLVPCDGRFIF